MAHFRLLLLLFLLAPQLGCFRYQTHIPGVLDLRSDASGLKAQQPRRPDRDLVEERSSLEQIALGRGVVRQGRSLVLEQRHYWVGGFIPLLNTSAADDIEAILLANPILTDVTLGDGYTGTDILMRLSASLLLPPLGFFMPPYTFSISAQPRAIAAQNRPSPEKNQKPQQLLEEKLPEEKLPEETLPEETQPEETLPEETLPEETLPEEKLLEEKLLEEKLLEEKLLDDELPQEKLRDGELDGKQSGDGVGGNLA